jgi:signal transduction histidine kinase/DNA-binding response OmpR family regulator
LSILVNAHSRHLLGEARATLADGRPRHTELAMFRTADQQIQVAWSLARVERGNEPHLLIIAQDVTEQKLLNESLVNARNAAQEAARITSAFLANMSHEIRTPMNAIVGLSRLALEEPLSPMAHDYIEQVHDSAHALMGILDDVLDYSKVEAGQMRLERAEIDLEDLLQRVAHLFSARVAQKHLYFDIELNPAVPAHIVGDPLRLSQILNNLVGNAIKFTDKGGVHVMISLDHGLLRFAIRDTGMGIAPDQRDALFAAFSQGDVSITRRFGGTGLGLAICKKLVDMMGGRIGVNSQLGQGSEFWFSVPLSTVPHEATSSRQFRVLLIGEDPDGVGRLYQYLQAMSQTVTLADSLDNACTYITTSAGESVLFDVVVVDWREVAPGTTQALHMLRKQLRQQEEKQVPFVHLLPGFERQPMLDLIRDEASDVLLTRPVLPGTLLRALGQACDAGEAHPIDSLPYGQLQQRGLPLRGRRVLLVEDNRLNQMVAQAFLQQAGLNVETLADGDEAVRYMESARPGYFDVILMDMHMPVMDGLEASRRIQQMPQAQNLPIIAMTAAVLAEDRERCQQAGMVDMVTKPIVPEALVDTLLKWVRH